MEDEHLRQTDTREIGYSFVEVANLLNVAADTLHRLNRRFSRHLSPRVFDEKARYTKNDVTVLATVQKLLAQGYEDEQISQQLAPTRVDIDGLPPTALTTLPDRRTSDLVEGDLPKAVNDVLSTIANSQQAVLNSQSTVRELLGVVAQDNFNLKDENRKLRDRMLELERSLAEYQRREETRKERLDGRLRALENTVAALQQQVAQLIQIHRQQRQRRGWFG
jgi:DNA-binding transcriptional MerR regulator